MLLAPLFLPIPPLSWSLRCLSYGRQFGKRRITIFFVNCDTGRKQYYIFLPKNKNKVLCRRLRNKCILIFTDVDLRGWMKGLVVLYYVFYWFLFTCSGSKGFVSNLFKLAEALKIFFGFSRIRVFFYALEVVQCINEKNEWSIFAPIIDILNFLLSFEYVKFSFVPRELSRITLSLAQFNCLVSSNCLNSSFLP